MTGKKTDDTAKTPKTEEIEEIEDAEVEAAVGGFSWGTSQFPRAPEQPKPGVESSDKPLSGTDLGSGRKK